MNTATPDLTITDADLLSSILGDDKESARIAFQSLVERYERLVWSVCHRQLNQRNDIEDAFQTTFLQLAKTAGSIRNPESLSSWLFGVSLRASIRIRCHRSNDEFHQPIDEDTVLIADEKDPLDLLESQQTNDLVNRQLELLDEKYRTPLILFYFAGLTTREIAHRLGISHTALEGRLRRARSRLRQDLELKGFRWSPVFPAAACLPEFLSCQSRMALACDGVTAMNKETAPVVSTSSGFFSIGTKLMICKLAVTAGLASLLAVGTWMHSPKSQDIGSQISLNAQQEEGETEVELTEDLAPPTTLQQLHLHLLRTHNDFFAHIHQLMDAFHASDKEVPGEFIFESPEDDSFSVEANPSNDRNLVELVNESAALYSFEFESPDDP